jgi:hypothetical protein
MEARRLRAEFVAAVRTGRLPAAPGDRRRRTFAEVADEWLAAQQALVDVGELAPPALDHYELAVRNHLKPTFGTRTIRSITPNDLVAGTPSNERRVQRLGRSRADGWRGAASSDTLLATAGSSRTPPTR